MLESLRLKGFQCHKDILVEFEQITCIVAENDSGKSALLRGLQWVMFNEPLGDKFINWDMEYCHVSLSVDNKRISRHKGRRGNYYKLDNSRYDALRSGVPPEISALLNVTAGNFQNQRDPVFMLSSSAGQISKELNSVIDLEVIDMFLANVSKEVRSTIQAETVANVILEKSKQRAKELKWIEEFDLDLQHIEEGKKAAAELFTNINSLKTYAFAGRVAARREQQAAELVIDSTNRLEEQLTIGDLRTNIAELDNAYTILRNAEHILQLPDPKSFDSSVLLEIESIQWKLDELRTFKDRLTQLTAEETQAQKDVEKWIKKLKGKCPTCGQMWIPS